MKITHASRLGNAELMAELNRLARCEREATAALIVHLAEFDARRLFEPAGYPSLFKYWPTTATRPISSTGRASGRGAAASYARVGPSTRV